MIMGPIKCEWAGEDEVLFCFGAKKKHGVATRPLHLAIFEQLAKNDFSHDLLHASPR
jgi:hypothetical protein